MVTQLKDNFTNELVPACSIQIAVSDRAKLNRIRGVNNLKTYSDTVKFLINFYEKNYKENSK